MVASPPPSPPPSLQPNRRTGLTETSDCRYLIPDGRSTPSGSSTSGSLTDSSKSEEETYSPLYRHAPLVEIAAKWSQHGQLVPQMCYNPPVDQSRRMAQCEVRGPITFFLKNPDYCGIPCRDALLSKVARLAGRDDYMDEFSGRTISLRIMWPGYLPWCRQIVVRDYRYPSNPVTRANLVKNIARSVQRFIQARSGDEMSHGSDRRWKVGGPNDITIDDLELVGLQQVSMASWQLHLRCVRRRM
ncbi:hypothetical protein NM688_g3755 [Phlebia brevispora]|uniref:Uncharacterized protein n=1 Tax=Phlebia brevispora TaxID=194682 RepID=A0ACC1T5I0_9APHY|nr:hypothetical protein NM688_g3755 [Phlebia brevispora]